MTLHTKRHQLQISFTINHEFQPILVGYSWQQNNGIPKHGANFAIVLRVTHIHVLRHVLAKMTCHESDFPCKTEKPNVVKITIKITTG